MKIRFASLLLWLPACTASGLVMAQTSACRVESFQGATLPQGATAQMRVTNDGQSCGINNYGVPADRSHPADSGSITTPPSHGVAEFVAPRARYVPEPGYVGDDEFEYEAYAKGRIDQQVRLKVRVKVQVVAPGCSPVRVRHTGSFVGNGRRDKT